MNAKARLDRLENRHTDAAERQMIAEIGAAITRYMETGEPDELDRCRKKYPQSDDIPPDLREVAELVEAAFNKID